MTAKSPALPSGSVRVEFDHNNDNNVQGSVTVNSSGVTFEYDPRVTDPPLAIATGALPLRYRAVELDASGSVVDTGSWTNFTITLEPLANTEIDIVDIVSGSSLVSGSSIVDFGTLASNESSTVQLTIVNHGPDTLKTDPNNIGLPAGFKRLLRAR